MIWLKIICYKNSVCKLNCKSIQSLKKQWFVWSGMPKVLLISENLIYSNWIHSHESWVFGPLLAYMLVFSCIFNPGCFWAQLLVLWLSFLSEAMENKRESEVFGKAYVAEEVGRKKMSFFPLRNFCIQCVSFQAKQMGILFIPFSCSLEKSCHLTNLTLVIHLDW